METKAKKWEYTEHTTCDSNGNMRTFFEFYPDDGSMGGMSSLTLDDIKSLNSMLDGLIDLHDGMRAYIAQSVSSES